jgi:energy-coupling factor transporter ATP-binding protein EcfA2
MLARFWIDNFKSLIDFDFPPKSDDEGLSKFICLVGLNGAGKSTILQAFDFIAHLPAGRLEDWLKERRWKKSDLASKLGNRSTIRFKLTINWAERQLVWSGIFNINTLRCTTETIRVDDEKSLRVHKGVLEYLTETSKGMDKTIISTEDLEYQGSVLSILKIDSKTSPSIAAVKEFAIGLKSLELLNPQLIKNRAREAEDIGIGGEKLTAYLYSMSHAMRTKVIDQLKVFYPRVLSGTSGNVQAGWKTFKVAEAYSKATKEKFETETIHLNDGMLRILAIITQMQSEKSFILLDEIENGINPELIERLMDYLVGVQRQIIVTTHSPMILNYLEDDIAKKGVFLISKNESGVSRCARFFRHPMALKKLAALGPGEVFIDSDLESIGSDLEKITP